MSALYLIYIILFFMEASMNKLRKNKIILQQRKALLLYK